MRVAWLAFLLLIPSIASAQVVETARDVDVLLRHGMALVTTRIEVHNRSAHPGEVALTLPTPRDAGLVALRVCSGTECRDGQPSVVPRIYETARGGRRFSTQPVAIASMVSGRRRRAPGIRVSAAPVVQGRPFEIELRYLAPTSEVLGNIDFALPAQASALGSPGVRLAVGAPGLELPSIDGRTGPIEVGQDEAVTFRARTPRGTADASAWSLRCGRSRCVRYRVAAGAVPATPRDVFLLHDVSPSAMSAEPGVRARALRTLLEGLSPASRVTRVAYAREARVLDDAALAPADVPVEATLPSLGIRTRFETAWDAISERVAHAHDPLIVIVGDGAISPSPDASVALDELADAGAQLSLVSIADRAQRAGLVATVSRTLGQRVEAYRDDATPALRLLVAPVVDPDVRVGRESFGPLRAGETRVIERVEHGGAVEVLRAFGRRIRPTQPRGSWATGLATRLAPEDPRAMLVAASQDQIQAARKDRRAVWGAGLSPRLGGRLIGIVCGLPICRCSVMGSVSRESLRRLRAHLRPAVRGCFARARRGRPSWSARMTLRMVIRYGELEHVRAAQTTDPALAQCIVDATERLGEVPFSETALALHFPFVSEPAPALIPEPLAPEVDRALESIGVRALPLRASGAP